MNKKNTPQSILQQIASIEHMERGKLSIIRQSANGAFYNLQHRENGRNVTEYIPRDQVPIVQEHVEAFRECENLFEQYVALISQRSREEREPGFKKKRCIRKSPSPRKPKSRTS